MAWERRGDSRRYYYYSAKRVGRRVLKKYCGPGQAGLRAAAQDAASRELRAQEARHQREWQKSIDGVTVLLDESERLLKPMLTAHLLGGGFKCHKRQWRAPRCCKKK